MSGIRRQSKVEARRFLGSIAVLGAVLLSACGDPGTQSVHPRLVPPPDTTDFGAVPVLNEKTMNVDVQNVGKAMLTVEKVAITEGQVPFRILSQPDLLGPSESKPIVVAFTPPLEQDYSATLVLQTDDPENPTVSMKLVGKGSTRAVMEVEPASLDFGRVAEGQSAVKTLTIRSKGTADLIVEDISFLDGSSAAFEFLGSVKTPATVPHVKANGLPGEIKLTIRYTVQPGAPEVNTARVHIQGTDPDNREVVIPITGNVNRAPIAVIQPLGVGSPGMEVTLDGSMSSDPDNDLPLTYKWVIRSKPLGAQMTNIEAPDQPVTKMVLDAQLPGSYEVELNVTDAQGARNLTPARATIVATPAQKLLVEMFTDNADTDIDLHMLKDPLQQVESTPGDCFYQNPRPDWGVMGDRSDDPEFLRDAIGGYGPEVIGYLNPPDNSHFRVIAVYQNPLKATNPATAITIRIYEYGVVKFEATHTLQAAGEVWGAADIEWPSGKITPLQQ